MTLKWRLAALLAAWVAGACGGEESTAPRPACTGPVTVVATREARPLFTWTPNCAVARLTVSSVPNQGIIVYRWAIRGGPAGIASGVRFGVLPPAAVQEKAPNDDAPASWFGVAVYGADGALLGSAPVVFP